MTDKERKMALRNIILEGDEILRKKCREITDFGEKTAALMDDLRETLKKAEGLGLAAPQVAILRRAAVIVDNDETVIDLINPEVIWRSDETVGAFEGCLSCPDKRAYIQRPIKVKVKAQDRSGKLFEKELEEMAARAACHEIDHLDGILFIDNADKVYTDEELEELFERQAEAEEKAERKEKKRKK